MERSWFEKRLEEILWFFFIYKVPDQVGFRKTGSSTMCTTSVLLLMLSTTRIDFIVPVLHPGGKFITAMKTSNADPETLILTRKQGGTEVNPLS